MLEKAMRSAADAVVIDWEDAVPEDHKEAARWDTVDWLQSIVPSKPIFVRINSGPSMKLDLKTLEPVDVAGVMVPKAETGDQVRSAASLGRNVVPLIESPLGIEAVADIAQACPEVSAMAFGSLDFMAAFGLLPKVESPLLRHAMCKLSITAAAAGITTIIDGVEPNLTDSIATVDASKFARSCGFTAKLAVHPNQIAAIRSGFRPDIDEVKYAEEVIAGFEEGLRQGVGAIRVRGQLVDRPVYNWALSVITGGRA